jgi:hypothetical protein
MRQEVRNAWTRPEFWLVRARRLTLVEKRRHRTRSMSRKREREFPGHSRELLPGRSDLPRGKQAMSVGGG